MAVKIIPMSPEGASRRTVDLGGTLATLTTKWNTRASCWSLDLEDVSGAPLVSGIMLLPDVDLLKPHRQVRNLLGAFFFVEKTKGAHKVQRALGSEVQLVWVSK